MYFLDKLLENVFDVSILKFQSKETLKPILRGGVGMSEEFLIFLCYLGGHAYLRKRSAATWALDNNTMGQPQHHSFDGLK